MNLFWLIMLLPITETAQKPRLTRILYKVELISGDRSLLADLALNLVDEQHFSISCRKRPGGTLFTYWALPQEDVLFFPKMDVAFAGSNVKSFGIFPGGPEMSRDQWLLLLYRRTSGTVGSYEVRRVDGWRVLEDPRLDFVLRWRETRRLFKTRYSNKVLQPKVPPVTTHDLTEMQSFWKNNTLDE